MEGDHPKNLRINLLAMPPKRRKTKKYIAPRYIPGVIDSGVRPAAIKGKVKENWRLSELSKMVDYKASEKIKHVVQSESKLKKLKAKEMEQETIIKTDKVEKLNRSYVVLPFT